MSGNGLPGDALWKHLRTLDCVRRLRCDMESLADVAPEVRGAVIGATVYIADLLHDRDAAAILRGPDAIGELQLREGRRR